MQVTCLDGQTAAGFRRTLAPREKGEERVKKAETDRYQVNVRVDDELIRLLDAKRVELLSELGAIPTRSEIVRIALERFLRPVTKKSAK